jgi:hypothetical protein
MRVRLPPPKPVEAEWRPQAAVTRCPLGLMVRLHPSALSEIRLVGLGRQVLNLVTGDRSPYLVLAFGRMAV